MLLAATSEAVMCLSFAFMQLTLSWQQPASDSHLKPEPPPTPSAGVCGGAEGLLRSSENNFSVF